MAAMMKYEQVVRHFGGNAKAAEALGLGRSHVANWKRVRIPSKHQIKIQVLTGGKLKPDKQAQREGAEFARYVLDGMAQNMT
jgi:hypothetical protein